MSTIPLPIYCAVTYFMTGKNKTQLQIMLYKSHVSGLRAEAGRYFMYTLALSLFNFTVGSLAMAIGAAVGLFSVANPLYTMILVVSLVICILCMCKLLILSLGV